MTILSDGEIRRRIHTDKLIVGPNINALDAKHCAFHFSPGKIYVPATQDVVDWTTGAERREFYSIQPGHLVWVRTQGQVRMPHDLCAFWWQTNALSRKGLMLVNMSMVEPGYTGCLSCLFVNFGKDAVVIHKLQPVAKLVFVKVEGEVVEPYVSNVNEGEYDRKMIDLMAVGPHSFLQIAQLSTRFDEASKGFRNEAEMGLAEIGRAVASAKVAHEQFVGNLQREAVSELERDAKQVFIRSFKWAVPAVLVVGAVMAFSGVVKSYFVPDYKDEIKKAVSDEVSRRMVIPAAPDDGREGAKKNQGKAP